MKTRAVHKRTYKTIASLVEDIGKNSFAYQKLMELLIREIINPSESIILGGTWRVPVMEELLNKNFVKDLKLDGTYNDASFAREYRRFVLFKLLRIAGNSLELSKLQHKFEIKLSVNV